MRIFYTAFDVVPGPKGASIHITHFVRGLVQAGHQVHLMTAGAEDLPTSDTYEGAEVTRVPPGEDMNFLARAVDFGKAVMAHLATAPPYDLVHFRSIWSGLHLAQARRQYGYRTLFEVNGLPSIELKYHYPELRNTALLTKMREQELATLALSDAVVCPANVTRAYLTSLGVPAERIHVIPNGFSPADFQPTPLPVPPPDSVPPDYTPTLLYIGTLADWQGLEALIMALPLVREQHPARLRIVGRGRSRQRKLLHKRVLKLGLEAYVSIEPAVPHSEVPALMAAADVCVAPLAMNDRNVIQGCCPIKVIEYMAAGRPLVAANLPVVRELVREDIDGLLFAPGDKEDLARQIVRLLDDRTLATRLATEAAAHAHAHLTWDAARQRLVELYARLESERLNG